jgi:hypothetical protein
VRSGFCGIGNPPDSHARCRMDECSCACHEAVTIERDETFAGEPQLLIRVQRSLASSLSDLAIMAQQVGKSALRMDEISAEGALRCLHDLRSSLRLLNQVDANLCTRAYIAGEHGEVRVDGIPPAKVQRGRNRKDWDERGAVFAYVDAKMRERDGELTDPAEVASWVLEVLSGHCRVTPLRAAGLDVSDYCTESPGKIGVTFVE